VEETVKFAAEVDGDVIPIEITGAGGRYRVALGDEVLLVDARPTGGGGWSLLLGQASTVADVTEENGSFVVHVEGEAYAIRVEEETRYIIRTRGGAERGQVLRAYTGSRGASGVGRGGGR
jgi:hypothetical protein